jgi:hypothetical protein
MVSGSGKGDLDVVSLRAIQEAGPFSHLPEISQPFIALRVCFYYNTPIAIPQKR